MPESPSYQRLFAELKRRNVFRIAAVYGATAFVAIQAADLVFPRIPLPEWTVALVVWLSLLGFPIALALAWAYELTGQGLKATDLARSDELDAIVAQPRRRRWTAGIAALLGTALLVFGAYWTLTRTAADAPTYDSIAVLPFADLSPGSDQQYFGDGLADQLINALAGVRDLKVAGRTSSFALRNENLSLRAIGDTLGVSTVLEGSVRRSADRVRINVQLIDAMTGFNLWADEYDREITDIFLVQEELARSIVGALIPRFGGDAEELLRGGTVDLAAFDLYLSCRRKWYTRQIDLLWEAIDECEEAVARDPGFALAWSGIADAIDALAFRNLRAQPLVPRARMAAQRAVLLDPELAEGWASWGVLASEADRDWITGELALRRAIELKPSYAYARAMLGDVLRNQGRVREGVEQHRVALQLDPLSPVINGVLGISLVAAHQFAEARTQFERTLATGGDEAAARAFLFLSGPLMALSGDEMADHGVRLMRLLGARDPELAAVIGHAFASANVNDPLLSEARSAADRLVADSVFTVRQIAVLYTRLGDPETALQWIARANVTDDLSLGLVGTDPSLDPLRTDPRMQRLMHALGLPNGYDPAADIFELGP
jgi:adenylate cyclase